MVTRHISAIALFQLFALGCAIALSAIAARWTMASFDMYGSRPLPVALQYAPFFRDYGIWCSLLIVFWICFALGAARSPSVRNEWTCAVLGFLLLAVFFLPAIMFLLSPLLVWI